MSSAKLSVTNVAAEPEEEGDGVGVGVNSISVEVSRSGIEPVSDVFYRFLDWNSSSESASSMDSEPEFIDFFDRDYEAELRLSSNQRLRSSGGFDIWGEDMELGLGIGSSSGDGDLGGVVVDREIDDVEVHTGIDLNNGDAAMVVDEEFEFFFNNYTDPIDLVEEEPIQFTPPRVNDWEALWRNDNRGFEDMMDMDMDMDLGLLPIYVYEDDDVDGMYEAVLARTFDSQEGVRGSPPASKSVVDNLPDVVITSEELRNGDIVCAVCKEEIVVEMKAKKLPCKHYYHEECIVPWLGIRNTCPVCRFELPTDDPEYETNKRLQRRG